MTYQEVYNHIKSSLAPAVGEGEATWTARIFYEEVKGWSLVDLAMNADRDAGDYIERKADETIRRVASGEPVQYIFGHARFYGMTFDVTPDVLIPRPETEELVDMIVSQNADRDDLRVLDVGTGSGCIAIALARNLPFARVDAVDVSTKALDVARRNAANLKVRVAFLLDDALTMRPAADRYDIIVSNPPYIAESERKTMDRNVLEHEPPSALFVPDSDPLRFYHAIARYAAVSLRPGGRLYFELNPLFADRLAEEMTRAGWDDVLLSLDIERKKRFLSATKKS